MVWISTRLATHRTAVGVVLAALALFGALFVGKIDSRIDNEAFYSRQSPPAQAEGFMREHFGGFEKGIARGLVIRHDHGSAYMSHDFRAELEFLGMESSPSFVREPEGNGCAERFIRTLKENLLWVRSFATVAELVEALREFRGQYNEQWLIGRHGYRAPSRVRREWEAARRAIA